MTPHDTPMTPHDRLSMMVLLLLLYEACGEREDVAHEDGRSLSKPTSPVQSIIPTMMTMMTTVVVSRFCAFALRVPTERHDDGTMMSC